MTEKCWSVNGEDYFDDWCRLIDELDDEELGEGTEYFEGDKVDVKVGDYVNMHGIVSMLEQFDDWVYASYRDWETDRKSTRLNSSHSAKSRMPSSA